MENSVPSPHRHEHDFQVDVGPCCPVEYFTVIVGGRWKSQVIWVLGQQDASMRFSDLWKFADGVSARVLTKQLRELEGQGIVYRDVYPVTPPRVEYGLTPVGRSLIPVFQLIGHWSIQNGWRSTQDPDYASQMCDKDELQFLDIERK